MNQKNEFERALEWIENRYQMPDNHTLARYFLHRETITNSLILNCIEDGLKLFPQKVLEFYAMMTVFTQKEADISEQNFKELLSVLKNDTELIQFECYDYFF